MKLIVFKHTRKNRIVVTTPELEAGCKRLYPSLQDEKQWKRQVFEPPCVRIEPNVEMDVLIY